MNSSPLPDLRDVTLCAVDTINPELAARALDISMSQCRFGNAVLFTHEAAPTRARVVLIDRIRKLAYVKAIHERYRKHWSAQDVMDAFVRNGLHEDVARHCVHICECSLK